MGAVGDEDGDQAINLEGSLRVKETRWEGVVTSLAPRAGGGRTQVSTVIWGCTHSGFEGCSSGG